MNSMSQNATVYSVRHIKQRYQLLNKFIIIIFCYIKFRIKNLKHSYPTLQQLFGIYNLKLIPTKSVLQALRCITCGCISYPLSLNHISVIWCFYCLLHLLSRTTTLNPFFNQAFMLSWQSNTAKCIKQPYVSPNLGQPKFMVSQLIWVLNEA